MIQPAVLFVYWLVLVVEIITGFDCENLHWSLFKGNKVVLPKAEVVREYAASVPPGFLFSIKVPNSITLTHHYEKSKTAPLIPNPYFLSTELMVKFLHTLEPLGDHVGPLIFQFEYLNKNKMDGLKQFTDLFESFIAGIPKGYMYCVEIRNPNFLKEDYFSFLADQNLGHVFLQGYYMPSIFELYEKHKDGLTDPIVIRLHGSDRQGMEERTKNLWDKIVSPKDDELLSLKNMVADLRKRQRQVFFHVNNHYEGSAPKTIEKIKNLLSMV
ncbi:MAG: DUF72 domain-containing protein [Proteobacteria bacterium]|nr:DUF72 domain-containing protein [Pseudomonadota bacterium]